MTHIPSVAKSGPRRKKVPEKGREVGYLGTTSSCHWPSSRTPTFIFWMKRTLLKPFDVLKEVIKTLDCYQQNLRQCCKPTPFLRIIGIKQKSTLIISDKFRFCQTSMIYSNLICLVRYSIDLVKKSEMEGRWNIRY